ncbi:hypothetical protein K503DRAFT_855849 [Rhizopogon vinicolor AM-OR11-026]|uniref:Uncharacterized protein n=1 Tax=Rhizopogon vinicolor AM-OR11-026 TaxID=1314800 RepID=A0A1B7N4E1_9AGAM|nr:hypothetical protein K503DRAFT_855849 [Rhizopogon vinicolor AM-OR11-026]
MLELIIVGTFPLLPSFQIAPFGKVVISDDEHLGVIGPSCRAPSSHIVHSDNNRESLSLSPPAHLRPCAAGLMHVNPVRLIGLPDFHLDWSSQALTSSDNTPTQRNLRGKRIIKLERAKPSQENLTSPLLALTLTKFIWTESRSLVRGLPRGILIGGNTAMKWQCSIPKQRRHNLHQEAKNLKALRRKADEDEDECVVSERVNVLSQSPESRQIEIPRLAKEDDRAEGVICFRVEGHKRFLSDDSRSWN